MKQLNKWLELEAIDKKKVGDVTLAITKMVPVCLSLNSCNGLSLTESVQVPVQPNYCDCGLYVLHFAKTFMSDPQRYSQIIMVHFSALDMCGLLSHVCPTDKRTAHHG
jgi:hypothetical protein